MLRSLIARPLFLLVFSVAALGLSSRPADAQPPANRPPESLEDRARDNVVAVARLWGYVRWFNPADEADGAEWNDLLLAAIERAEPAKDDAALAEVLLGLFRPLAPSLEIFSGEPPAAPDPGPATAQTRAWRHVGVKVSGGQRAAPNIYRSERLTEPVAADDRKSPPRAARITRPLTGTLSARWLLVADVDDSGRTLPRAASAPSPVRPARPDGWRPSGLDRTSRLADIIVAWNVFQHFYPYFDVTEKDWESVLPIYLNRAAATRTAEHHGQALECLVTELHDGHARVLVAAPFAQFRPRVAFAWAGQELVVTDAAGVEGFNAGDRVLAIGDRSIERWLGVLRERISAASDGWFRWRFLETLPGEACAQDPIPFRIRRRDGSEADVPCPRVPAFGGMAPRRIGDEPRRANGVELAPGIIYIDSSGLSEAGLRQHADKLAAARGIVIDARGYPSDAGITIIRHLIDKPVMSAQWWVPVSTEPDRVNQSFQRFPGWVLQPAAPRWTRHVAYVTDGRAISYAESCLGIVEHYKLAEIVGQTTAGTNGNVNPFTLPTGVQVVWTGMRVLKHDGSRHHGVGIAPTVPVERTADGIAAGRDELLDKAVDVLRQRIAAEPPAAPADPKP